ncbi:26 kDa periplasmic immunogenic protein precursor [Flavobacterium succinicans]|uniref:26 kDa periplasmic immunogenic protein n=2 Tax=Flavobacterium succinicans TaxID=29536 RepID=A0A199XUM5_9FLAO|nr:26 kDa periplasmic immunogenic protein precursor [Flavobacterium succinicans]
MALLLLYAIEMNKNNYKLNPILMKKVLALLFVFSIFVAHAQDAKPSPQISVSGEGRVKITPDQAVIVITVVTKGANAKDVKKENDLKVDAVLKFIKKVNLPTEDYKTRRVALNPQYEYESKKRSYNASQTIEILLKDLTKYDSLMEGLVDAGVNNIDGVTFQSSKLVQYQAEARKLAMKDAKAKADDFVSVLGQKVGKALMISDNSQNYYPSPVPVYAMKAMNSDAAEATPRETLAIGEIAIVVNVSVSFILE